MWWLFEWHACFPKTALPLVPEDQGEASPEKKAKTPGARWNKPPPLVTGGRRQWSFGHKLYALIKLREVGGNKSKLVRDILPHWNISRAFLVDWEKDAEKIREECRKLAGKGAVAFSRKRIGGGRRPPKFKELELEAVAWLDGELLRGEKVHPIVFWDKVEEMAKARGIDTNVHLKKNWRVAVQKRYKISFKASKRVSTLTPSERCKAALSFLTYLRVSESGRSFWQTRFFSPTGMVRNDLL